MKETFFLNKKMLRSYFNGFLWLILGLLSHIPSHFLRNSILRLLGMKLDNAVLYSGFHIRKLSKIRIGKHTIIGHGVTLDGRNGITIGENVNISSEVMLWTMQHDYNDSNFSASGGPIIINDYAWISARAIILPNITIGKGAVVAAGSVVTKDVEDYTVVGGIPAKKIANRNKNLEYSLSDFGVTPFV